MASETKTKKKQKKKKQEDKEQQLEQQPSQPKMEISFWEKLGDSLSKFSEGVSTFLTKVFGDSNERAIRAMGYIRHKHSADHEVLPGSILDKVNALEPEMQELTDEEIKEKTLEFKKRLREGETLEDLLPETFALCREAAWRTKNMRHFDVQILGGVVLHRGQIAEMVTGEGKTLVATLPAYLNALEEKGVHIVTVNDYLARRDCEWMSPIYQALGVSAGFIQSDMDPVERRAAYDCDITYGTNSEFGFDYLRDNMIQARWGDPDYPPNMHQCQKALHYAIIDEVDNILIDEARTPLIISGPAFGDLRRYSKANDIVLQLTELQKQEPGKYFEVKEKDHSVHLTDDGIRKAEELAGVESFYTAGNMEWPHLIDNSLKAHHLYHKDKQYVVMRHPETHEMSVIIVDEFTGRLMEGRQWSDGLHQAVEAKHAREGVKIKEETQTLATVTLQNFFKLYEKLAGMTGTAMTEGTEFWKIYKLDVIAIPTNKPLIREDHADVIYMTEKEKWGAIAEEVERLNKWDIITLTDGEELFGTVKKESEWDILTLTEGEELVGRIKSENTWDIITLNDGTELIGKIMEDEEEEEESEEETEESEEEAVTREEAEDQSEEEAFEEDEEDDEEEEDEEGEEEASDEEEEDEEEEEEEIETVRFQVKDTDEIRTITSDQVAEHVTREEIVFRQKGEKSSRTILAEEIESRDQGGEIEIVLKGSNEKKVVPLEEIEDYEPRGRPILIGTTNVDKSERLSQILRRKGIKFELLNAKPEYADREAEIVAQAGRIGAVSISTNMAGRGTDIVLGGNSETMAWAKLKDKYESRLDVPPEEWKSSISEIEAKEKMKEEGRKVAAMGGLHVIGTERHESRRIDNQLRGRSGRQGDPGSTRFFLCLEDDLMRVFAGEWVQNVLKWAGMEEGQAIESRMVSRRIETAQKKVEERNFDIRRNLLEYDEVMDHQRKTIYGYRQDILEANNCKILVIDMLEQQIEQAVAQFTDELYGAGSFASFASSRLAVEFRAMDFNRMDFEQAERYAREKASKGVESQVHDIIEENLSRDVEEREWNWQAATKAVNSRWGLKVTERQLKKIGHDNLGQYLIIEANQILEGVDLSDGKHFLELDWGIRSMCDWVRLKFQIELDPEEFKDADPVDIKNTIFQKVKDLYHEKDIEFPVILGMGEFMPERGGGKNYDREGLYQYCEDRFPSFKEKIKKEEFVEKSRPKLYELLMTASRDFMPELTQFDLDDNLEEAFEGASVLDEDTAQEFSDWLEKEMKLEVSAEDLEGSDFEEAQQIVWNAYDSKYRPEMRQMERNLLLNHLDSSWKNHLYTMDHLKSGIGLVGYAQEDPKTVYKKEGMKEFENMWSGIREKVSDTIFRMEEAEAMDDSLWTISKLRHDEAGMPLPPEGSIAAEQQQAIETSGSEKKKAAPIRNRGQKIGRNEPCPCGSG